MRMRTKVEESPWSRSYRKALGRYVKLGTAPNLRPALRLGRQAVTLNWDALDLSRIHEQALATMDPRSSSTTREETNRARKFFAETVVPIEQTHTAARKDRKRVHHLTRTLTQRAAESSASVQDLKRGVARRRTAETLLKKSGARHAGLLLESSRRHKRLRKKAHEILSAHEKARLKASRLLHDEIAQALLSIHLSLLALRTSTKASKDHVQKEITGTERLVRRSARKIQTLARKLGRC